PCRGLTFGTAPKTKIEGVKRWGATPIPMPREELLQWMADEGWKEEPESFIHPFADEEVIAGHGGLGLELIEDVPDVGRVVVPVGGGGLASGIASALKGSRRGTEAIRVQSHGSAMWPRDSESGGPWTITPEQHADATP